MREWLIFTPMSLPEPKNLVFLGSKPIGYQCFEYLLSQCIALNFRVSAIITQSRKEFGGGNDIASLAREHGVPVLSKPDELPACDIIYSVQHHQILRQTAISLARQIAVNLHMAPLPEYRGCNQFSMAIIDGKKVFGTTIHQIDERIDHGDILFEKRFPIPDHCWVQELYELTEAASFALFKETLPAIISGEYTLTPQADLEAARGTSLHFRNEIAALKQIDLSWDADKISRRVRATSMPGFEPPFAVMGAQKVYFTTEHS